MSEAGQQPQHTLFLSVSASFPGLIEVPPLAGRSSGPGVIAEAPPVILTHAPRAGRSGGAAAILGVLAVIGSVVLAAWTPARRALRIEPATALRTE